MKEVDKSEKYEVRSHNTLVGLSEQGPVSQELLQQNNKLIAEFMGYELSMSYYIPEHEKPCNHSEGMTSTFFPDELEYHSNWSWLMPVAQKCREMTNKYQTQEGCGQAIDGIMGALFDLDLGDLYKGVIGFIKWYNKLEKS